jgi:hypothetical protein
VTKGGGGINYLVLLKVSSDTELGCGKEACCYIGRCVAVLFARFLSQGSSYVRIWSRLVGDMNKRRSFSLNTVLQSFSSEESLHISNIRNLSLKVLSNGN